MDDDRPYAGPGAPPSDRPPGPGARGWSDPTGGPLGWPDPTRPRPGGPLPPPEGSPSPTEPSPLRPVPPTPTAYRRGPRRARLSVRRVDPWSVLRFTFIYSLALLVVGLVAVVALWLLLDAMGVFDALDRFVRDVNGSASTVTTYFSLRRVVGAAAVVGGVNVVLLTALATLGAFLYNLCSELVGGIEVTLSERD